MYHYIGEATDSIIQNANLADGGVKALDITKEVFDETTEKLACNTNAEAANNETVLANIDTSIRQGSGSHANP